MPNLHLTFGRNGYGETHYTSCCGEQAPLFVRCVCGVRAALETHDCDEGNLTLEAKATFAAEHAACGVLVEELMAELGMTMFQVCCELEGVF